MYNKIIKAKKLINQHIINTPSSLSHALSEVTGHSIFVKYENKQFTGSFKYRGSLNKLLSLNQKINQDKRVEVILLSRNTADTGLRVFNSIQYHNKEALMK